MTQFNNMTTEDLRGLIGEYLREADTNLERICSALVEVKRRSAPHELFKHKLYRWYAEVASGKLHPGLVFLWNGDGQKLQCFVGRPLDFQLGVLTDRDIGVVREQNGKLTEVRQKMKTMKTKEMARVLPKGEKQRTFDEQREILQAEISARVPKTETVPEVKGDAAARVLRVGKYSIPLALVKTALAEIGLAVTGDGYDDQHQGVN